MAIKKNTESGVRETRLGSITGYNGTLKDLHAKSGCGGVKDKGRCFSQASILMVPLTSSSGPRTT